MTAPDEFFSRGDGPLAQFLLTLGEIEVLEQAVSISMNQWERNQLVARSPEIVKEIKQRLRTLNSLRTALAEGRMSIERVEQQ